MSFAFLGNSLQVLFNLIASLFFGPNKSRDIYCRQHSGNGCEVRTILKDDFWELSFWLFGEPLQKFCSIWLFPIFWGNCKGHNTLCDVPCPLPSLLLRTCHSTSVRRKPWSWNRWSDVGKGTSIGEDWNRPLAALAALMWVASPWTWWFGTKHNQHVRFKGPHILRCSQGWFPPV